ncbi:hypothetical protein BGZ50_000651 [Haplosporangium sp. Z 11]|nr:hypothetical protein BGZ50_000651 [Haplosporangium sp. Z 11]
MVESSSSPKVLIVGAGIAGLLLGILLERASIPYEIFERAPEIKPLGSIISLNANILPVFEQLGMMDEMLAISYPCYSMNMYQGDMTPIAHVKMKGLKELVGYDYLLFSRPDLYNLLYSKVPEEKLYFGKKILSLQQDENGVTIRAADSTTYHGDILVGADGTYSGVRQSLYKEMQKKNALPTDDAKDISIGFSMLVGTTNPLDQDSHEHFKDQFSHYSFMVGKDCPYTWSIMTVPGNRICWGVQLQLDTSSSEDESFCNSEWSSETNQDMLTKVNEFQTPYGKLSKLIEATDKDKISKVFLEDKMFETWYHGRTVLIGDAAHKMLPSSGQGAVNALQDAVVLANCLYEMTAVTPEAIIDAFKDFKDQRHPHVLSQYIASKASARFAYGQKWWERMIRHVLFNYLPEFIHQKTIARDLAYRPQVAFLPLVPNRGTSPAHPQKSSKKYTELQKKQQAVSADNATTVASSVTAAVL